MSLGELYAMSIGVGYTEPFKLFAAEWIKAPELAKRLNDRNIPGVKLMVFGRGGTEVFGVLVPIFFDVGCFVAFGEAFAYFFASANFVEHTVALLVGYVEQLRKDSSARARK